MPRPDSTSLSRTYRRGEIELVDDDDDDKSDAAPTGAAEVTSRDLLVPWLCVVPRLQARPSAVGAWASHDESR